MNIKEWTDNQRRIYIDTVQLYEAFTGTLRKSRAFRGGMHWKKSNGREYLFRSRNRKGYGKSLGPRSPETEKIMIKFHKEKQEIKERLKNLKNQLAEQARFCKAAMIQRVPRVVTGILRIMEQHNILDKNVMVADTNAIYAYEAASGVFLDSSIMATRDIDILWDTRSRLKFIGDAEVKNDGFLGILQKADKSFDLINKSGFSAVNKDGFMVYLIKPEPKDIRKKEIRRMGKDGDMEAAEIRNLQWLASSPEFYQTVIGDDGFPALMTAPDPHSFALHKLWLCEQRDREAVKKKRDKEQGLTIIRLTMQYLPGYPFKNSELRMFPKDVIKEAALKISDEDMPAGFDMFDDF